MRKTYISKTDDDEVVKTPLTKFSIKSYLFDKIYNFFKVEHCRTARRGSQMYNILPYHNTVMHNTIGWNMQVKRMSSTFRGVWQPIHSGGSYLFSKKAYERGVYVRCEICQWSTRIFLLIGSVLEFIFNVGWKLCSLLLVSALHSHCHCGTKYYGMIWGERRLNNSMKWG